MGNSAIAELFWMTKLSAIAGFYCMGFEKKLICSELIQEIRIFIRLDLDIINQYNFKLIKKIEMLYARR